MTIPSADLRAKWLAALLPNVPFDGWTREAAKAAALDAGLSAGEQALAAPRGLPDLVDGFFDMVEQDAANALKQTDLTGMGVRQKVALGVTVWLDALAPNKEAARRAGARGFLPWVAGDALQRTYSVADMIWTATGDTSSDYNQYSKRGLLAATLPLIFVRWLDEDDEDAMQAYIARRLTRAMKFGQVGGKIVAPLLNAVKAVRQRS